MNELSVYSKIKELAESYNDYPQSATNNAKRALEWADKNGWGSCGTPVGKARANQLANREPISRETIARMASFKKTTGEQRCALYRRMWWIDVGCLGWYFRR